MLGRFTTPDPASDPGWNLQLYGLGDPVNLYDPEGLGVVSTLVRLFGDEQINQFSDADLDAAYGNDKDVLMGMSYGARNAITLGFYADYESPDEFAKRNGCKADTAAFAAASIATEFACDFALSAATGGAAGAIKGGLKVAQTTRRLAKAWQAAQWTSDAIHAAKGVATYTQTGDATQLLGAAGMAGSHALGRVFSSGAKRLSQWRKAAALTGDPIPRRNSGFGPSAEGTDILDQHQLDLHRRLRDSSSCRRGCVENWGSGLWRRCRADTGYGTGACSSAVAQWPTNACSRNVAFNSPPE